MSLVAELKRENKQLKKQLLYKEKEFDDVLKTLKEQEKAIKNSSVIQNREETKIEEVKEDKEYKVEEVKVEEIKIAKHSTPKLVDTDKFIKCTLSQNNNITEGQKYYLLDKFIRRGNIFIEIIDNNNIIRTYNQKFFA